ncbi:hypothetical protein J7J41_01430 [bacterium]|nr:hypothetical protein [bacterium]
MKEIKAIAVNFIFFLLFLIVFGVLFTLCGCGVRFKEVLSEPFGVPWDSCSYKFLSEVKSEIQKKIIVVVGNKKVCVEMKRMEYSIAPWQKVLILNHLNEIVIIELGFETRNDYWSPNLKKFNSIMTGVITPKKAMLIVLPYNRYEIERRWEIKGRYKLIAEAHQRTATGEYISGENIFYLDLGYRKMKKVDCGKFKCKVGQVIKLTRHNLRKPFSRARSQRLKIIPQFIRYSY